MGTVDQVTQRNASAAEELSSTAEEMSSQAESLQQLMAFFSLSAHAAAPRATPQAPAPRLAHAALAAHGPVAPARTVKASSPRGAANGAAHADEGGFKRF
jgi:methyl-accepting chemotaxis protein